MDMTDSTKHSTQRHRSGVRSKLGTLALAIAASTLLSGCFLRSLVGMINEEGRARISTNVEASFCEPSDFGAGCEYVIRNDNGDIIEVTSSLRLIVEGGLAGVLIDPLILQVPADVSNVVATYNNAGVDQPLVLTETTSFPVTPGTDVVSEADTKFLILELPDAEAAALPAGGADFDFSLDFDVTEATVVSVKPMLTGSFDHDGVRHYLPLFPCVTDFAQVPALQIPGAFQFENLRPQALAIAALGQQLACDQVTYDFTAAGTATTTTTTATTSPATSVAASTDPPVSTDPPATLSTVLPETGAETSVQIWVALVLLGGGVAVMLITRRRPSSQATNS